MGAAPSVRSRDPAGGAEDRQRIARTGCRGASDPSESRTVSDGSSTAAVEQPASTTSAAARKRRVISAPPAPLMTERTPGARASFPSRVTATLT